MNADERGILPSFFHAWPPTRPLISWELIPALLCLCLLSLSRFLTLPPRSLAFCSHKMCLGLLAILQLTLRAQVAVAAVLNGSQSE